MKKIGMFLTIIALTVYFTGNNVSETSSQVSYVDPGYGDIG
ncbi:hypothetical protein VBD025_13930 [Virgibacillus flavescens]